MRVHQTKDEGNALAGLARQVDRLENEVAGLATLRADIDEHSLALRRLSDALAEQATSRARSRARAGQQSGGDDGDRPAVAEWLTVQDPGLAVRWLDELSVWVARVWNAFQPMPDCWPWHPTVVAELLACRASWTAATGPDATPDALSAWHDRWRPGTAARVGRSLSGCVRAGLHVDGAVRCEIDPTVLDEVAVWWATTHGTAPAPGLSRSQEVR